MAEEGVGGRPRRVIGGDVAVRQSVAVALAAVLAGGIETEVNLIRNRDVRKAGGAAHVTNAVVVAVAGGDHLNHSATTMLHLHRSIINHTNRIITKIGETNVTKGGVIILTD